MNKIWQETIDKIEKEVSPQNYATWIKPLNFIEIIDDQVKLEVPNRFIRDWLRDNYLKKIEKVMSEIGTVNYRVNISINSTKTNVENKKNKKNEEKKEIKIIKNIPNEIIKPNQFTNINNKYTFDSFVSGI